MKERLPSTFSTGSGKVHKTSLSTKVQQLLLQIRVRHRGRVVIVSIAWLVALVFWSSRVRKTYTISSQAYRPRCIKYLTSANEWELPTVQRMIDYPSSDSDSADFIIASFSEHRKIEVSEDDLKAEKGTYSSGDYNETFANDGLHETEECKAQHPWQLQTFLTCNTVHEVDLEDFHPGEHSVRFLDYGYWRDVWSFRESPVVGASNRVLKTMRYRQPVDRYNFGAHRLDALAMERLTSSRFILNIYGFCGNAGIFEYAPGGSLVDYVWPRDEHGNYSKWRNPEPLERLEYAAMASTGLADFHNFDKEGVASIAHTDIDPSQFLWVDGRYQLNDFNRARFVLWNVRENKPCGFKITRSPGVFRSPEEYERMKMLTEKVDVYALGNVLYTMLTGFFPFQNLNDYAARTIVKGGGRPFMPEKVSNSTDPAMVALREAMEWCFKQDPNKRATARQIETMLKTKLLELNPTALNSWGIVAPSVQHQ